VSWSCSSAETSRQLGQLAKRADEVHGAGRRRGLAIEAVPAVAKPKLRYGGQFVVGEPHVAGHAALAYGLGLGLAHADTIGRSQVEVARERLARVADGVVTEGAASGVVDRGRRAGGIALVEGAGRVDPAGDAGKVGGFMVLLVVVVVVVGGSPSAAAGAGSPAAALVGQDLAVDVDGVGALACVAVGLAADHLLDLAGHRRVDALKLGEHGEVLARQPGVSPAAQCAPTYLRGVRGLILHVGRDVSQDLSPNRENEPALTRRTGGLPGQPGRTDTRRADKMSEDAKFALGF
jgi:hypothetical protein